jgi:hypothetical protein
MTPLDIAELVSIVRDTRAFNKGDGIYNFSRLSSLQRADAADDAWHGISNRMDAILLKVDQWELSKFKSNAG